jgi:hypothetical protein
MSRSYVVLALVSGAVGIVGFLLGSQYVQSGLPGEDPVSLGLVSGAILSLAVFVPGALAIAALRARPDNASTVQARYVRNPLAIAAVSAAVGAIAMVVLGMFYEIYDYSIGLPSGQLGFRPLLGFNDVVTMAVVTIVAYGLQVLAIVSVRALKAG